MSKRLLKVESVLSREILKIISRGHFALVFEKFNFSFVHIDLSADLLYAKVYLSSYQEETLDELTFLFNTYAYKIRQCLFHNLSLKRIPSLSFFKHTGVFEHMKMENLLHKVREELNEYEERQI